ncbi:vitellogenin-1-like [Musca vetustissima]|uniref:vitellogenin-1-like n=1 Tax=Musca vetustissima TaxID=27455 RepID=UPI002AB623CD|nr:vitellogenin-1-like [Musca vetustissima]
MNPLKALFVVALLAGAVCGNRHQSSSPSSSSSMKPSQWLSHSQLQKIPALDEVSIKKLENMPLEEGAKLLKTVYHVSQINSPLPKNYSPKPSSVPVYIVKSNGQKESTTLDKFAQTANQESNFGKQEVTIFITGLPSSSSESVEKANRELVEAYMERYNVQRQKPRSYDYSSEKNSERDSSSEWETPKQASGSLVIIDLGEKLHNLKEHAMLDVSEVGAKIAREITKLDCRKDIIHIVAQSTAAHVAGECGKEFKRLTGNKLNRITALDPAKLASQDPETLNGLARGDAIFVDAIHTSAHAMGTPNRVANADFYPNGPSESVPGANNVVEACMRATRYFAESVRPGNERNFPAVESNSFESYKSKKGYGKRVYMGIDCDEDLEGDYILEVDSSKPFGKRAPAHNFKSSESWKISSPYSRV